MSEAQRVLVYLGLADAEPDPAIAASPEATAISAKRKRVGELRGFCMLLALCGFLFLPSRAVWVGVATALLVLGLAILAWEISLRVRERRAAGLQADFRTILRKEIAPGGLALLVAVLVAALVIRFA